MLKFKAVYKISKNNLNQMFIYTYTQWAEIWEVLGSVFDYTVNLLCRPKQSYIQINGLRRV